MHETTCLAASFSHELPCLSLSYSFKLSGPLCCLPSPRINLLSFPYLASICLPSSTCLLHNVWLLLPVIPYLVTLPCRPLPWIPVPCFSFPQAKPPLPELPCINVSPSVTCRLLHQSNQVIVVNLHTLPRPHPHTIHSPLPPTLRISSPSLTNHASPCLATSPCLINSV